MDSNLPTFQPDSLPARSRYLVLAVVLTLLGMAMMAAYGWLLVFEPDVADQLTAVAVIGGTVLLITASPLAGLVVWMFLAPFAPFLPFDINLPAGVPDLSYTRMAGGFFTLYLLAQIARGRQRLFTLTPVELLAPLFVAALLAAAIRADNGWLWGLQSVFDSYLMPLLVYFVARHVIQQRQQFWTLGAALLAIGAVIALLAIAEQTAGVTLFRWSSTAAFYTEGIRKVAGLLGNPAYIALAIAVIAPLALTRALAGSGQERLKFIALFLFLEAGILLTYNRSGWIAGVLAAVVVLLVYPGMVRFALPGLLAAGAALFLVWSSIQDTAVGQRISSESPIEYRLVALEYGLDIHAREPLLGIGWGSFGRTAAQMGFRLGSNIHVLPSTHNTYLNLLVSGGYFLLGSFLLLAAAVTAALFLAGRDFRRRGLPLPPYLVVAWASLSAYYIPSVGFDNNFALYANMVFWALIGAALGAAQGELAEQ